LSALEPEAIRRVGPWPVKRLIGQGGFSWVFEVEDENLGVSRALKMLKPEAAQGEQFKRFWNEARILAGLKDAHLVTIFALDRDPVTSCHYYVMEYLTGADLAHALREEGPLPFQRAVPIFAGALQGLAKLHQVSPRPIIHRDLKPANIQITAEGDAKLLDLGIARTARSAEDTIQGTDLTGAHGFIGTPKYASPEQLGQRELGPPSDVFSMGICLFEALEGHHPYNDLSDLTTLQYTDILMYYGRLSAGKNELELQFVDTPKPLREVIRKAVRVRPSDRYRNAHDMREALLRAFRVAEEGTKTTGRALRVAAVVSLAAALVGGGYWAWTHRPQPTPAEHAETARAGAEGAQRAARAALDVAESKRTELGGAEAFQDAFAAGRRALVAGENALRDEDWATATRQFTDARAALERAASVTPVPDTAKADAERERAATQEVKRAVDERLAAKTVAADDARALAKMVADADAQFAAGDWDAARRSYHAAASFGQQIHDVPPPPIDGLAEALARTTAARSAAVAAGADPSSSKEFKAADDKLAKAQALPHAQGAEALRLAGDAGAVFDRIANAATKLLDDARGARERADAAARRMPSPGSCSGLETDAQAKACQAARTAFQRGDDALAKSDAGQARTQFGIATTKYEEALRPPENKPPVLAAIEGGGVTLELGQTHELRTSARDPEGGEVQVRFTVRTPSGAHESYEGNAFTLQAKEVGRYTITAGARDAEGKQSGYENTTVVVREAHVETPPAPPPQVAKVPPPSHEDTSTGDANDVNRRARKLIGEYESAIESRDIDALNAVWAMDSRTRTMFEGIFETYPDVKANTVLREARATGDDQMELRFTQIIQVVQDGKLVDLAGGLMKATAIRRGNAWQLRSLVRDSGG
jgi:serine/threonine-protein kinase